MFQWVFCRQIAREWVWLGKRRKRAHLFFFPEFLFYRMPKAINVGGVWAGNDEIDSPSSNKQILLVTCTTKRSKAVMSRLQEQDLTNPLARRLGSLGNPGKVAAKVHVNSAPLSPRWSHDHLFCSSSSFQVSEADNISAIFSVCFSALRCYICLCTLPEALSLAFPNLFSSA